MIKRRKIHIRVMALIVTLCLCFSVQASATEADLKKQQKETQRQLDEINNQMKSIENQQKAVLAEIDSLDSELMNLVMNLEILAGDLELNTVDQWTLLWDTQVWSPQEHAQGRPNLQCCFHRHT